MSTVYGIPIVATTANNKSAERIGAVRDTYVVLRPIYVVRETPLYRRT